MTVETQLSALTTQVQALDTSIETELIDVNTDVSDVRTRVAVLEALVNAIDTGGGGTGGGGTGGGDGGTGGGGTGGGGGTTIPIVESLPVTGDYVGQAVIYLEKLYVWNGTAWILVGADTTDNTNFNNIYTVDSLPTTVIEGDVIFDFATGKIYKGVNGAWVEVSITQTVANVVADASITVAKFAQGIRPVEIVDVLPTTGNSEGRLVYLTTDDRLYRYNGTAFTSAVPTSDLTGTISAAQIAANAVTSEKILAGAITAGKIAVGAIGATQIAAGAINAAQLAAGAVTADKIAANAITAGKIAAGAVTAEKLATGVLISTSAQIGDLVVTNAKIANLTIGTDKVANNAITTAVTYLSTTPVLSSTWAPVTNSWVNMTGVSVTANTPAGSRVLLFVNADMDQVGDSDDKWAMRILRNGTALPTAPQFKTDGDRRLFSFVFHDDAPATGNNTYQLQFMRINGDTQFTTLSVVGMVFKK